MKSSTSRAEEPPQSGSCVRACFSIWTKTFVHHTFFSVLKKERKRAIFCSIFLTFRNINKILKFCYSERISLYGLWITLLQLMWSCYTLCVHVQPFRTYLITLKLSCYFHRCQPSRNSQDSPRFGASVLCPARKWKFTSIVPEFHESLGKYWLSRLKESHWTSSNVGKWLWAVANELD